MKTNKAILVLVLSGMFGACGQAAQQGLASIDDNATTIQASCADASNSVALRKMPDGGGGGVAVSMKRMPDGGGGGAAVSMKRMPDGGGGGVAFALTSNMACASYLVEINGTCENCQSVLVEAGDQTVSVTVNEDGTFSYSFKTPTISNIDLTPLSF
jgi:hypothetical protein